MVNLEHITNLLAENADVLKKRNSIDLSMFPEEQHGEIYSRAAECTLKKRDFDCTAHYLFLGKQWGRLLELGVPFFRSESEEEKKAGRHFIYIVAHHHHELPEDVAVELADHILEHEGEHSRYLAANALKAGKATERAEEVAKELFKEGNFNDGERFLSASGKKLSQNKAEEYAGIALEKGRHKDAFDFYASHEFVIPKERAKVIAEEVRGHWFDNVVEYMEARGNPFTGDELKGFADMFFRDGNHHKALQLYKKAGDAVSSTDFKEIGDKILDSSYEVERGRTSFSPGQVFPSVDYAYKFLSEHDPAEAKKRIAKYADALLEEPDFAPSGPNEIQFGVIYKMLELSVPVDKALKAAQSLEQKGRFDKAAEFYTAAGMPDIAKKMGSAAFAHAEKWHDRFAAKEAYRAAGDEEGIAVSEFLDKNFRD
jgi:tetratricopeptide (TPR) repeat protein